MSKLDILIGEDDVVVFKKYEDLSYMDLDEDNIYLAVNGEFVGEVKVWLDSEMADREYIAINHEIIYLDTIKKS